MAKKKEEPIVDNEVGKIKVKEKKEQQPTENETKGNVTKVKEKMKMKPIVEEESITKIDLSKTVEEKKLDTTDESNEVVEEIVEDKKDQDTSTENKDTPVVEEITEEKQEKEEKQTKEVEELKTEVTDAIIQSEETGKPLPESVQKLITFMEETGGDLNDYITLNQDFSELDNHTLLKEYYKKTKPHLSPEEIDFLMEDQFSYDEEIDDDKAVKRKKLALKEQVASAKSHLDGLKSKYYEDIKAGSKLTGEQQKAWEFFNRYKRESAERSTVEKKQHRAFLNKTNDLFNNEFKGFEYNVGDKKFRYNVKDADSIKNTQSDINNFIRKFLNKNNEMSDAKGYHKGLFTAMNSDAIANHFYEQGKADALKDSIAKSKNIDMNPRQQHSGVVEAGGVKVRVLGESSNDFKFKIKNKNK